MGKSYDDVARFLSTVHKDNGFHAEAGDYLNLLGLCEIADALRELATAVTKTAPYLGTRIGHGYMGPSPIKHYDEKGQPFIIEGRQDCTAQI